MRRYSLIKGKGKFASLTQKLFGGDRAWVSKGKTGNAELGNVAIQLPTTHLWGPNEGSGKGGAQAPADSLETMSEFSLSWLLETEEEW